jgi:SulP family sulfate permease
VLIGVAISTAQYVSSASLDVKVRRLVREGEGRFREEDPPERLPDGAVTVIDVYGSIFYAATDIIADKLPDVRGSRAAVLVLRLRGRGEVGSSAIGLFRRYATDLQKGGGALLLAGVGHNMADQLERTGMVGLLGPHSIFPAHSLVYQSTEDAFEEGRRRLPEQSRA